MAVKNQIVGGAFQDASGNPVAFGTLFLALSQDSVVISSNEQVGSEYVLEVPLDANGNIVTSPEYFVWPNDVISPPNSFYNAYVKSARGEIVWGPNAQQIFSEPVPFDVGVWVPGSTSIIAPTFSITVGTTTTLPPGSNATVENVGTSASPVLDFGIPEGASGSSATPNTASDPLSIAGNNIALTGIVPVVNGGTGASNAADARTNLGINTAGGDLSGTFPNPTVAKVNSIPYSNATPVNTSTVEVWAGSQMAPRQLTQDDILPGFSITSLAINGITNNAIVETGVVVTNPIFTATYNSTPSSAQITNTDGIGSPLVLTTPFTSGTVVGSFTKTSTSSTTFTLTAVGSSTKTSSLVLSWQPRSFGGVGTAGAVSATASGVTAILNTGAVLADGGVAATDVGKTYGSYTASGQKVYLLLIGGTHTFKDAVTGFAFAFNTPISVSFANAHGATVPMFLYESTNTLTGSFSVLVVT